MIQFDAFMWHAWRRWLFIVCICLFGCHHRHSANSLLPLQEKDLLPNRVENTSDKRVIAITRAMRKTGVIKVMSIGSGYLVRIPSSALFENQSPKIKWSSYAYLNQAVAFMKQFRKVEVTVTAHAAPYLSTRREKALTLARAREVADYLWFQGIDSRFIFAKASGSEKPITTDTERGDFNPNSRIDIIFYHDVI